MPTTAALRPYLLALSINGLFFLWAWLGFNHEKGLFFYTIDALGLMLLLPLVVVGNTGLCFVAFVAHRGRWAKAFGFLLLLSMAGCTAAWIYGAATGVSL